MKGKDERTFDIAARDEAFCALLRCIEKKLTSFIMY
jgi:hypothetical protein